MTTIAAPPDILGAALGYAGRGWPVFPCKPRQKVPATPHGFEDATTDATVIRAWWARNPGFNVAIATGEPGPDVVDIDIKPDGSGFPAFHRLKRAGLLSGAMAFVATRNGGLHVYFAGTAQRGWSLKKCYVDFRGAGGYVVAAPSIVPAESWAHDAPGNYKVIDSRDSEVTVNALAVRRFLDPPSQRMPRRLRRPGGIGALAAWVAQLGDGERNNGLFWAACRAIESGHGDRLDDLSAAAVEAGLPEDEAARTIASAVRTVTR